MISPTRYKLLILSPIPVLEHSDGLFTLDLWARDLEGQLGWAHTTLLCPLRKLKTDQPKAALKKLPPELVIYSCETLAEDPLAELVSATDVIQIPGNAGWRGSGYARRLLKAGRRANKIVVVGVSSNRARTAWLNRSGRGVLQAAKGLLDYVDIRLAQSWLALRSDGVIAVGKGVARLFRHFNRNIHVSTASWIKLSDVRPDVRAISSEPLRLCIASRLERMKGIHVGISAVAHLVHMDNLKLRLIIIGDGPELSKLQQQASDAALSDFISFRPSESYPQPFLNSLTSMDFLLLTNLNDEQPRVLFDAISRGCVPICPDTPTYRQFGLDSRLFYKQGNAQGLARAIETVAESRAQESVRKSLPLIAGNFTIDSMHHKRATWISSLICSRNNITA